MHEEVEVLYTEDQIAEKLEFVSKRELWDHAQRLKRRLSSTREKDRLIDRLQHQVEELHGTFTSMMRDAAQSLAAVSDASTSLLRRRQGEIHLCFPMGEEGEFRFSCSLEGLSDPDVRDALAKGRALLEGLGGR